MTSSHSQNNPPPKVEPNRTVKQQEEQDNLIVYDPLTDTEISSRDIKKYRALKKLSKTSKYKKELVTNANNAPLINYTERDKKLPTDVLEYDEARERGIRWLSYKKISKTFISRQRKIDIFSAVKTIYLTAKSIEGAKWVSLMYLSTDDDFAWRTFNINQMTLDEFTVKAIAPKFLSNTITVSDAEIVHLKPILYPNEFMVETLLPMIPSGGGNKKIRVKSTYYKAYSQPSKNNNCLFMCIKILTGDKSQKRHATMRKECGITHNNKISLEEIPIIEEKLKIKIDVYEDYAQTKGGFSNNMVSSSVEYSRLYSSKSESQIQVNVLLKDDHYYYITEFISNQKITDAVNKVKKALNQELANEYTHFVTYDMETVYDSSHDYRVRPYSISWCKHKIDTKFDPDESNAEFHYSSECVSKFLDFISSSRSDEKYIIIGYNNSRFDNYLLVLACERLNIPTGHMLYVNNSILTMNFKNHKIIDLNKFLTGSLKHNCISFKTNPEKLDGFDHSLPQQAFNEQRLDEWIESNIILLTKYNKYDVLSLMDLVIKFQKSLEELKFPPFYNYTTIGQMGYHHCKKVYAKKSGSFAKHFPRPKTREEDEYFRSCLTAGRVQCFRGDNTEIRTDRSIHALDVVSMYPFVMNNCYYPTGAYTYTKKYMTDRLGVYKIKYKRPTSVISGISDTSNILAYRSEDITKPLDWSYSEEFITGCTNLEIELCIKYGHQYEVIDGYYWENSTNKIFTNYITPLIDEKSRQDLLRMEKSDEYSQAMRETCKLLMNAVSGKVIQRNFRGYCRPIRTRKEKDELMAKTIDGSEYYFNVGNNYYLSGKFQDEYCYTTSAKPSYIGLFIYSYARTYMYELLISKCATKIYQDTDSLMMEEEDYLRLVELNKSDEEFTMFKTVCSFKDCISTGGLKKLGQIEEEAPPEVYRVITIAPKTYMMESNTGDHKFRYKGLCKSDCIIGDDDVELVESDIANLEDMIPWAKKLDKFGIDESATIEFYEKKLRGENPKVMSLLFKRTLDKTSGNVDLQMFYHIKQP